MKEKIIKSSNKNEISRLLSLELSYIKKPFIISAAAVLISVIFFAASLLFTESYAFMYAVFFTAVFGFAVTSCFFTVRRTYLDINTEPLYKAREIFSRGYHPTKESYAKAKLLSAAVISFAVTSLSAASFYAVSLLDIGYIDGYFDGFVPFAIAVFSFLFYMTSVSVTSAADLKKDEKKPQRRCVMGGILLYTLGLSLVTVLFLAVSEIPLGESSYLILSLLYLAASMLRAVYLYFILKKRLSTALKLR